jgi:hypothetical protein
VLYDHVLRAPAAIALTFSLACSSKPDAPRAEPPAAGSHPEGSGAGERAVEEAGEPGTSPRPDRPTAGPAPARPAQGRAARPIDIVLRSSPSGATAAVDGVPIGPTPTYWSGDANGREREFTFVLPGYAFARYRFVPITSGVVHARLEVLTADTDAGVPPEPEMMRVPDAVPPEPRPRTPAATAPPTAAPPSHNGQASPAAPPAPSTAPSAPSTAPSPPSTAPSPSTSPSPNTAPTSPDPAPTSPNPAPTSPNPAQTSPSSAPTAPTAPAPTSAP